LLAFTDGVTDARGASGLYGEERLLARMREGASSPPAALLDAIESSVVAHAAGWEQADDITLLAVRRA
jgi:sigma-B regulation protein RsbU (phosphoserine phosphatase)